MNRKTRISLYIVSILIVTIGWFFDFPSFADATPSEISKIVDRQSATCRVYSLGGFIDQEYLWRIDAQPEAIAKIVAGLEMKESPTIPNSFWRMPPYYWPRVYRTDMKAYRTELFFDDARGSDGNHYFLLHDIKKNRAYVWFRNNF